MPPILTDDAGYVAADYLDSAEVLERAGSRFSCVARFPFRLDDMGFDEHNGYLSATRHDNPEHASWDIRGQYPLLRILSPEDQSLDGFPPLGRGQCRSASGPPLKSDFLGHLWEKRTGRRVEHSYPDWIDIAPPAQFGSTGLVLRFGKKRSGGDGVVILEHLVDGRLDIIAEWTPSIWPQDLVGSPIGSLAVAADRRGSFVIVDPRTGRDEAPPALRKLRDPEKFVFDPSGRYIVIVTQQGPEYVWGSGAHSAIVWDLKQARAIGVLRSGSWIKTIAFSPDTKIVAAGDENGAVTLMELATGAERTLNQSGEIFSLAFQSPANFVGRRRQQGVRCGLQPRHPGNSCASCAWQRRLCG